MAFAQNLVLSSFNAAKSAQDCSDMSDHSGDCESGPWSVDSYSDLCTPMPDMTRHPIGSERSRTPATQMSSATSDVESTDQRAGSFAQPTTPPSFSATGRTISSRIGLSSAAQSATSDRPSPYRAFNDWRPESIGRAPFNDYHSTKVPSVGSEHGRSASHHSIASSADSWNSHNPGDLYSAFLPRSQAAPLPQMGSKDFPNPFLSGMSMFPSAHGASLKQCNLLVGQNSLEALTLQNTPQDARSLFNSLATSASAYPTAQMGATAMMSPQAYTEYNPVLGASPLMYLYGLSPELLASRSNALAQMVNASVLSQLNATPSCSEHDGPSPANKKNNLYKTELCRSWEEKGTCRYGSKCQYAHGKDELKDVNRHPKFKTEVCRTFWLHGSCPYGKRCCFLHTSSTAASASATADARDNKKESSSPRNEHEPPTSRLQKRVSANLLSAPSSDTSPQINSAPIARSVSDNGHSRSNSNSSSSLSSDGSSHIDSLRIQIWPRFGARDQVPPQDAPGPRSRLQRLRLSDDYTDCSSLPSTSTLSATRHSPFVDRPPHSAYSDISSILACSPSHPMGKALSATRPAEAHWPLSRFPSSANSKA